jgi:hypothetical protein
MSKNSPIIIKATQIVNNYLIWREKNRFWDFLAKSVVILTIILGIIRIGSYWKDAIFPGRIYLSIWEPGKEIRLNEDYMMLSPINPVKAYEPVVLRFTLTQNNVNSPKITRIFVTFPPEAEVNPISYKGWNWQRNNDEEICYFLDYPADDPAVKGGLYNLPAFEVKFNKSKLLSFKYSIIGDKINPIVRRFVINTAQKGEVALFKTTIFSSSCDSSSATPSLPTASPIVVEWEDINRNSQTPNVATYHSK